jgi:hypothetical protein
MIIKLRDIPVVYISPDNNEKYHHRKIHMDNLLTSLGFKKIIHYKTGTNYPRCLVDALLDIFSKIQPPFIFCEDDIMNTIDIPEELVIPDNTDAFYLGLGAAGAHPYNNYDQGPVQKQYIENFSDKKLFKIKNMLTMHAKLFITPNYIAHLHNELLAKIDYYTDVIVAQNQDKFNVYSHDHSYFYQAKEFGGMEEGTKITFEVQ